MYMHRKPQSPVTSHHYRLLSTGSLHRRNSKGPSHSMLQPTLWSTSLYGPPRSMVHLTLWSTPFYGPPHSMVHPTLCSTSLYGPPHSMVHPTLWSTSLCRPRFPEPVLQRWTEEERLSETHAWSLGSTFHLVRPLSSIAFRHLPPGCSKPVLGVCH